MEEELTPKIKAFIQWKDDPKTPFDTVFNGLDKSKPRITYRKGNADKEYSIEDVWNYWNDNIFLNDK
jgi:hypothetical protein